MALLAGSPLYQKIVLIRYVSGAASIPGRSLLRRSGRYPPSCPAGGSGRAHDLIPYRKLHFIGSTLSRRVSMSFASANERYFVSLVNQARRAEGHSALAIEKRLNDSSED